jgi:hypothetical protein
LRVARVRHRWTYSYSRDPVGESWTTVGSFRQVLAARTVGLFAGNESIAGGDAPAIAADFDYFFETATPVSPEDPAD